MACQSSHVHENLNNGFTPLVERLHSFSNLEDTFDVNKMKDYLQGNVGNYESTLRDIRNDRSDLHRNIGDNTEKNTINGSNTCINTREHEDTIYNNTNNTSCPNHINESDHDNLYIDENISMEPDIKSSNIKECDNREKIVNDDDFGGDDENECMSDSYMNVDGQVSYTNDVNGINSNSDNGDNMNNAGLSLEAVVENEDIEDDNTDAEFTGLQKDNGIYTGSRSHSNSQITVSECDSTSLGSEFFVERSLAAEIANSIQLGDVMCQEPQEDKLEEEIPMMQDSTNVEMEPRKERWTMKIKVGSTSDGSRCEIIKQIDYEDAKKSGLIKGDPELLNGHSGMHKSLKEGIPPCSLYAPIPSSDIKMVVGKRRKEKKAWKEEELSLTTLTTPSKKVKGGLRSDCPPFCRTSCTKIHHPLLVTARRMIENDSNTTIMFLEQVSRYYGGDLGQMTPATEIQDPWKDTSFPLLHYLALMGKCSGCFALVDAGQSCVQAISLKGDTVLHTMVRELYNFNCTHGHMDILIKKFTILLKEFSACLLMENYMKETPFHLIGKLISGTSQLLNIPGRNKLPYRLYQFAKNMLSACLEQYVADKLDPEILNRQDTLGNTISHYVAQDRASHILLEKLLEKGANFTILNHAQQNIEDVKIMAPPAPDSEILELAEFSAKGNKYKKAVNKRIKVTMTTAQKAPVTKKETGKKRELTMEQATDNFMEMLNSKLSTMSEWEPIEKMKLKKKPEKRSKASTSSSNTPASLQPFDTVPLHTAINQNTKITNAYQDFQTRSHLTVSSAPSDSIDAATSSNTTCIQNFPVQSVSSSIADVTSANALSSNVLSSNVLSSNVLSSNVLLTDTIKVEKPDDPGYAVTSNLVTDISIVDKLCNLSNSIKTTSADDVNATVIPSLQNKPYIPKLSHVSIPNVRPTASIPPASNHLQYPIISNVQTMGRDVGMQNLFMFRQHGPPLLTQRPRMNIMNQSLPSLVPRPPPALQPSASAVTSQQPLLLKTADGKLMSINVVQVSKGNTQVNNTTWHQQVNSMPPLLNVHPSVAHSQRPQFIDPSNIRYITPSMVNNSFRPPDPNSLNASSVSFANSAGVGMQHPTLMPNILPQSFRGGGISMPNLNSVQNPSNLNILSQASLIQKLMTAQSLISSSIQNTTTSSKYDAKKSRGLEASIENLRYSAMNSSIPSNTSKNKNSSNKSRLAASMKKNTEDSAPQVIILDEESSVKRADTRELQSPSIESSQDLDSPQFRDIDGVASFMKNYLQEKGSIEDFLRFSNEKKEGLFKQLEEERKKMQGVSNEIVSREVDIKDTRETVVGKEMEIAHLRLKLTKIQNDVNQLRNNRQTISDSCTEIEKRVKTLEDQTALFTTWSTDSRSDK